METLHFKGDEVHAYGFVPSVGSVAPEFKLAGTDLGDVKSTGLRGHTVVLNIFPSLDTEVCARSVRRFNEEAAALPGVKVVCVSMDLPFAMSRFCTLEGINGVTFASAFRDAEFAKDYGVMMIDGPLKGLLARAVVVIAPDGKVAYRELVNEITDEPDYKAALGVIRSLENK